MTESLVLPPQQGAVGTSTIHKFDLRDWLVPPILVPVFLGLACRRSHRPLVIRQRFRQGKLPAITKEETMKKPVLSLDEPEPKKAVRADRPPTEGFATIVDGHFKSEFDTAEGAEAAGRKLKSAFPMLQIEIYDAVMKVRTPLS